MKAQIFCSNVGFCDKGQSATQFSPGDFIVVNDKTIFSKLIRFGQGIRFKNSPYNKWTHAAMIVDQEGAIIEATGKGVRKAHLVKYINHEYLIVNIQASEEDRGQAVNFANYCLNERYDWMTIVSIALSLLTGQKLAFNIDGEEICSGLIARALERTAAIFPRDASHITPSELAQAYLLNTPIQSVS